MEDLRYEIKYILNHYQLAKVEDMLLTETFFKKKYNSREIFTVYLDDLFLSSAKDNITGISKRKKIRIRWYKNKKNYLKPNLEIKYKDNKLGYKKIYKINLRKNILEFNNINDFISDCTSYLKFNYTNIFLGNLRPVLLISYKRKYLENENKIRLTIDEDIKYKHFPINSNIKNLKVENYNKNIVEIKFQKESFDAGSSVINKINLSPQRHSKYLVGLSKQNIVNYL